MYPQEGDTRIGGMDTALEVQAKRTIMSALDGLRAGAVGEVAADLWNEIAQAESVLHAERSRKAKDYEQRNSGGAA
jgi:hypothetical protein